MIKIVAESVKNKNKTHFVVKVVDGDDVIDEQIATTINKRDQLIWGFAEQFNTTDIHIINEVKTKAGKAATPKLKFKFSEIPSIPVLDMEDAADFFDENENIVYNRVLIAVGEGIEADKKVIRLFELNGTGVYLTSEKEDWIPGLVNAEKYFIGSEDYEKCALCVELLNKLK